MQEVLGWHTNSRGQRAYVMVRLRLDSRAGRGVPDEVWVRLAAVLDAKGSGGVSYLRPVQERRLRQARLHR